MVSFWSLHKQYEPGDGTRNLLILLVTRGGFEPPTPSFGGSPSRGTWASPTQSSHTPRTHPPRRGTGPRAKAWADARPAVVA
jgi:hypothetical protein